jgi:hypothetical protein
MKTNISKIFNNVYSRTANEIDWNNICCLTSKYVTKSIPSDTWINVWEKVWRPVRNIIIILQNNICDCCNDRLN